jgi:hypothetical protein
MRTGKQRVPRQEWVYRGREGEEWRDEMHMGANEGFWPVWTSFYTVEIWGRPW